MATGSNKIVAGLRMSINGAELKGLSVVKGAEGLVIIEGVNFQINRDFIANHTDGFCRLIKISFSINNKNEPENATLILNASGHSANSKILIKEFSKFAVKDNEPHVNEQVVFQEFVPCFITGENGYYEVTFTGVGVYNKQAYDENGNQIGNGNSHPVIDADKRENLVRGVEVS
jgi:hypothetical protein